MCEWRSALNPDYHCRVSPEPGSDYCIFHEPGEKDIGRFKQKFYEQIDGDGPEEARNPRYDFRGYFFPTGIVASGGSREAGQLIVPKEIAGDLIGSEATIKGYACFWDATIKGDAHFRDATIKGYADFRDATIKGNAYFRDATIEGNAYFAGVTIEGYAYFWGARIEGYANFWGAAIEGNAHFRHATIRGYAYFGHATIEGGTLTSRPPRSRGTLTSRPPRSRGTLTSGTPRSRGTLTSGAPRSRGALTSGTPRLGGDAYFSSATIKGYAYFGHATIKGDAHFRDATIKGNADFWDAAIEGNADFRRATIEGDADFWDAAIEGNADFWDATLEGDADFRRATIEGDAQFRDAAIEGNAYFRDATIEGDAYFRRTRLRRTVYFGGTSIKGKTEFALCQAGALSLGDRRPTILLWWVRWRCGVRLHDVKTSRSFWSFARVTFERQGEREKADAAHYLERLVRVSPRRIPFAGRWWNKAYQTLRRLRIVLFPWFFDCLFLRWPTAYGASLLRLFITWAVIIGGFAGAYTMLILKGFSVLEAPGVLGLGRAITSFWGALYFSVITFTTLGYGDIRPTAGLPSGLAAAEAVLGGIMMALTVLVIGRKFMR